MKTRKLFTVLLCVLVVILGIFAARSIMRPEKFRHVFEERETANIANLTAIRSAQAVYKNVNKKYADNIETLVDFVNNGTVTIEKNVGNFPDTMSEKEAFKLGLIHKETVKVPAIEKILEIDHNLSRENFRNFQYIPGSKQTKKYAIQTDSIASRTYSIPVYRIDIPVDDVLINMEDAITPPKSNVFKKVWNKIFYNHLDTEEQYKLLYKPMYMGSLTEASTAGSWE